MPSFFYSPPLSTISAHHLTILFAAAYVGSIYISKNARLSFSSNATKTTDGQPRKKEENERWRDDPDVIRARLAAVSTATIVCCVVVFTLLWHLSSSERVYYVGNYHDKLPIILEDTITRLGLSLDKQAIFPVFYRNKPQHSYPYLVVPLLFLGPIYGHYLFQTLPFQVNWSFKRHLVPIFWTYQGLRNYILGPITEEIVFRSCVIAVYHLSGASKAKMIFLTPLSFGLAHVHHAWETYNRYGRTPAALRRALLMSLFQLIYTSLFGFYCAYLFLRTSSIYPTIVAHIWCNIMGLPDVMGELGSFPHRKLEIIMAYLLGIIGFVYTIGPWTWVDGSMYWIVDPDVPGIKW